MTSTTTWRATEAFKNGTCPRSCRCSWRKHGRPARVLADHYQRVTLIERDPLPTTAEHRKGVPHGRHLHGLHPRGLRDLRRTVSWIHRFADADGAVRCDIVAAVLGLKDSPQGLLRPDRMLRVLRGNLRRVAGDSH